MEALRDALLEHDELVGDEITEAFAAAGAPVLDGLQLDRRDPATDRRRTDWLRQPGG